MGLEPPASSADMPLAPETARLSSIGLAGGISFLRTNPDICSFRRWGSRSQPLFCPAGPGLEKTYFSGHIWTSSPFLPVSEGNAPIRAVVETGCTRHDRGEQPGLERGKCQWLRLMERPGFTSTIAAPPCQRTATRYGAAYLSLHGPGCPHKSSGAGWTQHRTVYPNQCLRFP